MTHTRKQIDKEVDAGLSAAGKAEREALRAFTAEVDRFRERILLALLENGELDQSSLGAFKQRAAQISEEFASRFSALMSDAQRRAFVRGIQVIDRALSGAGILKTVPYLSEQTLERMQQFGAELITGLTDDARRAISRVVNLAVAGQKSSAEVAAEIGKNLKGASVFGTIQRRAEIIVKTEVNRMQQEASTARLKQVGQQLPDLMKQWQHSHVGAPRPGHLALDGERIKPDERFTLRGEDGKTYEVAGPYDPRLPAGEVVNCRCKVIPVVGRFLKESA